MLVRRAVSRGEMAFFTCHTPSDTPLSELVAVAGARWAIEECFQTGKNETGLDHYQVSHYDAWYRRATFTKLALAFLQVTAAQRGHHPPVDNFRGHTSSMITTAQPPRLTSSR
jgi:SRSO17 transposase